MNVYQKIAFGAFGLLALALMIGATYDLNGLKIAVVFTLVVALLTLAITWRIIYGIIQMIAATLGFIGHAIGKTGDWVADKSFDQRQKLSAPVQPVNGRRDVPDWGSSQLATVGAPSSDGLAAPGFLSDTMDRQN